MVAANFEMNMHVAAWRLRATERGQIYDPECERYRKPADRPVRKISVTSFVYDRVALT